MAAETDQTADRPAPPFVLTVDVGSSSIRARLYDARGRYVEGTEGAVKHVMPSQSGGGAEEDPLRLADEVERAIDIALERAGGGSKQIAAVGLDTLVGNVMGIDAASNPTTSLYTYADTRSAEDVARMRRDLDAEAVHQRTGVVLHTAYTSTRLPWVRRTQPEAFERTAQWVDFATFLYRRWFGRPAPSSYSVASWSGLLNRESYEWDSELLDYLGVDTDRLPPLSNYDDARSGLSRQFAERWPALRETPFMLAVGDGAAANVGEGCGGPGRTAVTLGTTGALRTGVAGRLERIPRGLSIFVVTRDLYLLGGAVTDAGSLFAWMEDTLGLPGREGLEEAVAQIPPDSHGLTVLPFLRGERAPGWMDGATGAITGIRATTTPEEIVRAGLEAVAYRFALICGRLTEANVEGWRRNDVPQCDIVLGGGAVLNSPAWCQIFADVLGRPVAVSGQKEATSRGVAVLALKGIGALDALDTLPAARGQRYTPDPASADTYRAGLERHHRLYHTLLGPGGECVHEQD